MSFVGTGDGTCAKVLIPPLSALNSDFTPRSPLRALVGSVPCAFGRVQRGASGTRSVFEVAADCQFGGCCLSTSMAHDGTRMAHGRGVMAHE